MVKKDKGERQEGAEGNLLVGWAGLGSGEGMDLIP